MNLSQTIAQWVARDPDADTRQELLDLQAAGNTQELQSRFSGRLAFGTAGLRGVVGAGPMRMNRLVIQETSAGLASYLLEQVTDAKSKGVVIGYDGRLHSALFAQDTAQIMAAMGLKVTLSDRPVATPVCAYALGHTKACAAIMVTASHNPPEYNGYKVYWGNGAQIIPPHDTGIADAISKSAVQPLPTFDADKHSHLIHTMSQEIYDDYLKGVHALVGVDHRSEREKLTIAYTPLHGVGAAWTEAALAQAGFTQVHTVASQREPDGHFPTVRFPNPEEPGAMDAVTELAQKVDAKLVLANDPDADRLAVAIPTPEGYKLLSGNQIGILMGTALLEEDPNQAFVSTSIVSSQMLGQIAKSLGATCDETLTGFKWIANRAMEREPEGLRFVFGYEEALGYTVKTLVRDKDGVSAAAFFAAMVARLHAKGSSVAQRLEQLYRQHGLYLTAQKSLPLAPGAVRSQDALRANPPTHIAGRAILSHTDLLHGTVTTRDGTQTPATLPTSDVLIYHLADGARVIVRPSGTEPKLKCYYEVRGHITSGDDYAQIQKQTQQQLQDLIQAHQQELTQG